MLILKYILCMLLGALLATHLMVLEGLSDKAIMERHTAPMKQGAKRGALILGVLVLVVVSVLLILPSPCA